MKRYLRVLLLIACILLGVGIIAGGVGVAISYGQTIKILESNTGTYTKSIDQHIDNIDIDASALDVEIVYGDTTSVLCRGVYVPGMDIHVTDGTLHIVEKTDTDFMLLGWRMAYQAILRADEVGSIVVTVPYDSFFYNVSVQVGSGEVEICELDCQRFVLQTGVGHVRMAGFTQPVNATIQMGGGDLSIDSGRFSCANISCAFGDVSVCLADEIRQYSVDASCTLGSMNVTGAHSEGIFCSFNRTSSSEEYFSIDTTGGTVSVSEHIISDDTVEETENDSDET